ncbi:MAG: topoisomerase DNA-binding C4 zinc finger domain-containing protein, partial [Oscillospiraceae bacterium]|nr:topoisomerase DNA-binding C4 zinc finger domain-containing protein [Oscillospiraceae bacterium]
TSREDIKIPVEETDIICDKCGSKMVVKAGRYGKFAACPNYPDCKNTKPLTGDGKPAEKKESELTDIKCELCGQFMVLRKGKYGMFYSCSDYPKCKNTKPLNKKIDVPCPVCGAGIVIKQSKKNTNYYSCEKYPDCKFTSWDMPVNEKCPKCKQLLYQKKGKQLIACHNKDCGYTREIPDEDN